MWGFEHAVRLREVAIAAGLDLPLYLLAPEVAVLLSYLPDMHQRLFLRDVVEHRRTAERSRCADPKRFFLP